MGYSANRGGKGHPECPGRTVPPQLSDWRECGRLQVPTGRQAPLQNDLFAIPINNLPYHLDPLPGLKVLIPKQFAISPGEGTTDQSCCASLQIQPTIDSVDGRDLASHSNPAIGKNLVGFRSIPGKARGNFLGGKLDGGGDFGIDRTQVCLE